MRPAVVALTALLAACGTTTVDTSITAPPTGRPPVTEVTVPADATPRELLAIVLDGLQHLDDQVVERRGDASALERIEQAWVLVEPHLRYERPEFLFGFEEVMVLARTAVERRRPADASKAYRIAATLLADYDEA